jgi:hypothetical protein
VTNGCSHTSYLREVRFCVLGVLIGFITLMDYMVSYGWDRPGTETTRGHSEALARNSRYQGYYLLSSYITVFYEQVNMVDIIYSMNCRF